MRLPEVTRGYQLENFLVTKKIYKELVTKPFFEKKICMVTKLPGYQYTHTFISFSVSINTTLPPTVSFMMTHKKS